MVRTGEVVDKKDGLLSISFERPAECQNCGGCMNRSCVEAQLPGDAEVGDRVDVELPEKSLIRASLLMYIFPLAGLLLGMYLGSLLHGWLGIQMSADALGGLCGAALLAVSLFAVWRLDKSLRKKSQWQPHIIRVHKNAS